MLGHDITAYDVSKVGLAKANNLAKTNNVSIHTEQINLIDENLPNNAYDNAVLVLVMFIRMIKQN